VDTPRPDLSNVLGRCRPTSRGAMIGCGLIAVALLGAGCGGPKTPSVANLATTTPSTTSSSTGAALSPQQETATDDAYADCVNAHGGQARVIPGGGVGFIITPSTRGRLAAAQKDCATLVPKGGFPPPTPAQIAQHTAQMLKLATCMRAHGVAKFPDPGANGSLLISSSSGIDPQSPEFQAAQKACASDFPGGTPP
jgi:hypothetical protein